MRTVLPDVNNRFLLRVSNKFRIYWEKKYFKKYFSGKENFPATQGKVLLYSVVTSAYSVYTEILLYHLLKREGYEVHFVACNGALDACEILTKARLESLGKTKACKKCIKPGFSRLKAAGINPILIKEDEKINSLKLEKLTLEEVFAFEYDGIRFGNHVQGVMYRYYKSIHMGEGASEVALKYLRAALTSYFNVVGLEETHKYNYIFFSHGIYSTWGAIADYCLSKGKKFVSYDRGKTRATTNYNLNKPAPVWDFTSAWDRYKNRQLSHEELQQANDYLKDRELQKNDVFAYNFSSKVNNLTTLKQKLKIPENKVIVTFFTNLIWDAANVSRDIAFASILEAILSTLNHFKNDKRVHFVVRCHPAEKVLGTEETYKGLLEASLKGKPDNLTILDSTMDINSFSVIELSDIGVTHTSTVGLEFAIEGKPSLLISETHYRGKGFTYDINSSEEYFAVLEKLINQQEILPNQVELAKKYFYMMMFLYQKKMPLNIVNGMFNGYTNENFNNLSSNEAVSKVIKMLKEPHLQDFIVWD